MQPYLQVPSLTPHPFLQVSPHPPSLPSGVPLPPSLPVGPPSPHHYLQVSPLSQSESPNLNEICCPVRGWGYCILQQFKFASFLF